MTILENVLVLGRIENSEDNDIIQHYIDILSNEALAYTQRSELSLALENLIISYTLKMYRADAINSSKNVSSIKRGDTQTNFNTSGSANIDEELLESFREALRSMKLIRAVI